MSSGPREVMMANPMTMSDPLWVRLGSLGPSCCMIIWSAQGDDGQSHDNVQSRMGLFRVSGFELLR